MYIYILIIIIGIIIICNLFPKNKLEGSLFTNKFKNINREINKIVYDEVDEYDVLTYYKNKSKNQDYILGYDPTQAYLVYRNIDYKNHIHYNKQEKSGSCCPTNSKYTKNELEYCKTGTKDTCNKILGINGTCKWNKEKCPKTKFIETEEDKEIEKHDKQEKQEKSDDGICCGSKDCNNKNKEDCFSDNNSNICYWITDKTRCAADIPINYNY